MNVSPVIPGADGIPRIAGIPVANLAGLIESGWTETEVSAFYSAGGVALSIKDVGAAAYYVSSLSSRRRS